MKQRIIKNKIEGILQETGQTVKCISTIKKNADDVVINPYTGEPTDVFNEGGTDGKIADRIVYNINASIQYTKWEYKDVKSGLIIACFLDYRVTLFQSSLLFI